MSASTPKPRRGTPRARRPLSVKIDRGVLSIKVGVGVLAQAFQHSEYADHYFEDAGQPDDYHYDVDEVPFAADVVAVLTDEAEDGSTLVTRLLDDACAEAVEQGSSHFSLIITDEETTEDGVEFDLVEKRRRYEPPTDMA